jgi:hypothetical protein
MMNVTISCTNNADSTITRIPKTLYFVLQMFLVVAQSKRFSNGLVEHSDYNTSKFNINKNV